MKVYAFTFIKNAIKLDYPVVEAIRSVLPLVDEVVVAVGKSEDDTRVVVEAIDPKVRIVDTVWDDSLREGGKVLAQETNKAFDAIPEDVDWCVYIQADECLHEQYLETCLAAMQTYVSDREVEGFLFNYKHFYGSYDYLGDSRTWYRKEIRIIRNDKSIRSWKDAQGFRKDGRKLNVVEIDADIYHYGWVRHPKYMMAKTYEANKLWHDDEYVEKRFNPDKDFDYSQIDSIKRFEGTHPSVMKERINKMNWSFDRDPQVKRFNFKMGLLYYLEKWFAFRPGEHRNYRLIKR